MRQPDQVEPGHGTGAPANPRMWRKILITTVIAAAIFGVIYWVIDAGLVSFREMVAPDG